MPLLTDYQVKYYSKWLDIHKVQYLNVTRHKSIALSHTGSCEREGRHGNNQTV